jgi:ABC-2 type transport system ATP-binding protein
VGYLPGELHLEGNFTVEGVLRYLNRLRGSLADWEYIRKLAGLVDLDLKIQVKNLSKGNKQKVGVIQALMHRPELLLLDEPTFGLDPLVQQEVLRLVMEARNEGATVFFSSHILSEVEAIAERVAIIRQGVVAEVEEIETLMNRSLRRVKIRFKAPIDTSGLENLAGVKLISSDDGQSVLLQVEGEMDALIKTLAAYPISDFETERPNLEEVFLAYYDNSRVSNEVKSPISGE